MAEPQVRRTGRPPKVSAETILDAAELVSASELTLTAVAETLGISVKTIYYYFDNRTALLRALTARAVERLDPPDLADCDDWRDALRSLSRWVYRALAEHPEWEFESAGGRSVGIGRAMLPCLEVLHRAGFSEPDALTAVVLTMNYAYAAAAGAARTERLGGLGHDNVRRQLDGFGADAAALALAEVMASRSVDDWFEAGLDMAIEGAASFQRTRRRGSDGV